MCNPYQSAMSQEAPKQKFGYLDIKQSSKVKPRKMKTWRRRWVVLTVMSDLSNDTYVAKLDLYDNEAKWRHNSQDKTTFVLENVTCIQTTRSRTHPHAFEVVEKQPVLVMSGSTDLESCSWILTLQMIFTPEQIQVKKETYKVTVSENEHSRKWNLSGAYSLTVSPSCISLADSEEVCLLSWGLSTLVKFSVEKNPRTGHKNMLVIQCGPNSPTAQSCFCFLSEEAQDILSAISHSISLVLVLKQRASTGSSKHKSLIPKANEKSLHILDSCPVFPFHRDRSNSGNSCSATSPGAEIVTRERTNSDKSSSTVHSTEKLGSLAEAKESMATSNFQLVVEDTGTSEIITEKDLNLVIHDTLSSFSYKCQKSNGSCAEINDAPQGDLITSTMCQPPDVERLRSVSVVVASLQASRNTKPGRPVSLEEDNDKKSDLDSAIASMSLSAANDEFLQRDILQFKNLGSTKRYDPCQTIWRRSSSTPDLQAYWKTRDMPRSENVYEELDDLRASMQLLNKTWESDIPPALPERPLSMKIPFDADNRRRRSSTLDDIKVKVVRQHTYKYAYLKDEKLCPSSDHCGLCKIKKSTHRNKTSISRTSSCEELIGSSCSSVNDLEEGIFTKGRRSSNITPVVSSVCLDSPTLATSNLHLHEKDIQKSQILRPHVQENFVKEGTNNLSDELSKLPNPLLSFFLDNENFESNPMVTGELSVISKSLASNFNALGNSIPTISVSGYINSELVANELYLKNGFGSNLHFPINDISMLEPWRDGAVKNKKHQISNNDFSPTCIFPASFANDPFTWNEKRFSHEPVTLNEKRLVNEPFTWDYNKILCPSTQKSSSQEIGSVYFTMANKPSEQRARSVPDIVISRELWGSVASVMEADGMYIRPSDLAA